MHDHIVQNMLECRENWMCRRRKKVQATLDGYIKIKTSLKRSADEVNRPPSACSVSPECIENNPKTYPSTKIGTDVLVVHLASPTSSPSLNEGRSNKTFCSNIPTNPETVDRAAQTDVGLRRPREFRSAIKDTIHDNLESGPREALSPLHRSIRILVNSIEDGITSQETPDKNLTIVLCPDSSKVSRVTSRSSEKDTNSLAETFHPTYLVDSVEGSPSQNQRTPNKNDTIVLCPDSSKVSKIVALAGDPVENADSLERVNPVGEKENSNEDGQQILSTITLETCTQSTSLQYSKNDEASASQILGTPDNKSQADFLYPTSPRFSHAFKAPKEKIAGQLSPVISTKLERGVTLDDSILNESYNFPKKQIDSIRFAYKADPTKKREERKKLCGYACHCCEAYFDALALSAEERAKRLNAVSKHRDLQAPPSTPDYFWEVGFPSTEEQATRRENYNKKTRSNSPVRRTTTRLYTRRKLS